MPITQTLVLQELIRKTSEIAMADILLLLDRQLLLMTYLEYKAHVGHFRPEHPSEINNLIRKAHATFKWLDENTHLMLDSVIDSIEPEREGWLKTEKMVLAALEA